MVIIILAIAAAIITVIIIAIDLRQKAKFRKIDQAKIFRAGTYIGGHPQIDNEETDTILFDKGTIIEICSHKMKELAAIKKEQIRDIKIENATTFESRISAGRILLVGVFALAWKKKSKNENAYLIIEWNDGRFNHSTAFLFQGEGSMQTANKLRNWIIRSLKD